MKRNLARKSVVLGAGGMLAAGLLSTAATGASAATSADTQARGPAWHTVLSVSNGTKTGLFERSSRPARPAGGRSGATAPPIPARALPRGERSRSPARAARLTSPGHPRRRTCGPRTAPPAGRSSTTGAAGPGRWRSPSRTAARSPRCPCSVPMTCGRSAGPARPARTGRSTSTAARGRRSRRPRRAGTRSATGTSGPTTARRLILQRPRVDGHQRRPAASGGVKSWLGSSRSHPATSTRPPELTTRAAGPSS